MEYRIEESDKEDHQSKMGHVVKNLVFLQELYRKITETFKNSVGKRIRSS